jgi:MarR family transcriptional regulator, transcriptional regulator for hemolysin
MDRTPPREGGGLGYLLTRAAQCWRASVAEALRPHGLTPAQFIALVTVLRRQAAPDVAPVMQRDLGEAAGMDPNTTSQVVRALIARKLVSRTTHPHDRRAVALSLTPLGRDTTRVCGALVHDVSSAFFAHADRPRLTRELEDLIAKSGEARS